MKNKIILISSILMLLVIVVFVMKGRESIDPYDDNITLKQAAKIGQEVTHKLLVQIEESKGEGRYERGDVILTASSTKQFSRAEKEGFLIIKMDLTPTQADVLVRSLRRETDQEDPEGNLVFENVKRRKYAVDLEKIDIEPDDFRGREVNETYTWDILYEKDSK